MNESLGKIFKDARRAKGITVGEVSKKTKISHNVISAIEEDNFEILSPVYMKSFIKLYAKLLDLDIEKILKLYHEYIGLKDEAPDVKQKPLPDARLAQKIKLINIKGIGPLISRNRRILALIVALIVIFFFGKFIVKVIADRRSQTNQEISKEIKTKDVKKENSQKEDLTGIDLSESLRLSVKAKADCWMNAKVDDKLIFQNILKKGQVENWQADRKIEIKIGNPTAIELELNGRTLDQFGKRASKARMLTITKEGLKIGK